MRRKVEINGQEFMVFGESPWVVTSVKATDKLPACTLIIEARLFTTIQTSPIPHRLCSLYKLKENGVLLPVAFVGEDGKARADDICRKINFHLG